MKRENWLDSARAFACILVALGHLLKSLQEAAISDGTLSAYGVQMLYHFHVYIFFFCSGFLFFRSFARCDRQACIRKKLFRCVDFLLVYILFSGITYLTKTLFSGDVNTPVEHSFWQTLLLHPINHMWYLYAIAVITLCTPAVKTDRGCWILLGVSLGLKLLLCLPGVRGVIPVPLIYLADHELWFALGVFWAKKELRLKKWMAFTLLAVFIEVGTAGFVWQLRHPLLNVLLTFTGVVGCAELFHSFTKRQGKLPAVWRLVSEHMLPIYLLHTIFAAGIRIVLLRLGVRTVWIHLPIGLLFGISMPIVCALIARRTKVLEIVFYPSKTLSRLRK